MISLITSAVNLSAITLHHHNANYNNTVNLQYPISIRNRYSQHLFYDDDTSNLHGGAEIGNALGNDTSYIDLPSSISHFNSTYSPNDTNFEDYTQIPYYIRATSMVFCIIIMCMGVIGNVMVPIVILKTKDMRNSTNIFLVNLSIADLMVLLVCTPTVLVEVNTKPETWVLGKELCLAVPFIELTVAHASVLTILAISFERYYAICEPLRAGYVCTKTRATLICALAWFLAAVFTSPILAIADHRMEKYQDGSAVFVCLTQATEFWPTVFFIMTISIFFFAPFVVLIILYTIIAKNLITASSKVVMNKHVDCLNSRARKQVILMLGTVVLCFFVCLLPFRILMLYIIIVPDSVLANLGVERYYNILFFCRTMLYLNSAINPILYNLMSSKFRKGFFRLFCCAENPSEIRNYRRGYRMRAGTFNTTSSSYTTSSSVSRHTNSLKNAISKKISSPDQSGTKIDDVSTNFGANHDGGLAREVRIASSQKRKELCKQNSDPHPTAIDPCAYENKYTNSTIYKVLKKSKFLRQRSDPINSHSESVENIISTSVNKTASEGNVCDEESPGSFDVSFKVNIDTVRKSKVDHVNARYIDDNKPVGRQRSLDAQNFRTNSLRRNVILNSAKTKSFDGPDVEESLTLGEIVSPKSACVFKQSSPILAVATYQYEEYFDGTIVAVCLTQADTFWPALFFILTISIFFIVPLAILIILYTIIAKNLMENPVIIAHHSKGNNMTGSSVLRYRKQVVLMLGTVVLSFFICLLPFRALTLWIIIVPPETIMSLGLEGYYILLYFCRIMLYLNSAVNPILYNLMSSKFRDGFIKLLNINHCIKCRRQLKDTIHRKDTFNTTTSTNFSSSQNTSDSFWRRYSRTSSQKTTNINDTNNGKNKPIREGEIGNVQQIKVGEIVNVQNTRRNSMRQVAELAALRNDVGSFDFSRRHEDENVDDVLEGLNETQASVHKEGGNAFKNKQIQILNLDVKTNNVYAVTLDMSNGEDNKNKFVCVPLLSGKDGNSVNTNKIFEYNSKESFV